MLACFLRQNKLNAPPIATVTMQPPLLDQALSFRPATSPS
ncbi:hypothetical protein M3J09_001720 [Ascochyta lentis]